MLYRTFNQKGMKECYIDQQDDILVGIDATDSDFQDIIGITKTETPQGVTVFRIPGSSIPSTNQVVFESVKAIVSSGGKKAAEQIGFWQPSEFDQYFQRLLDLHFVYCMPDEVHYIHMLKKNPTLLKMVEKFDLQLVPVRN